MAAGRDTPFSCTCGQLTGTILNLSPETGVHARCFCADCRAAEVHLGQPDPGQDGVGLFQLSPDQVRFDRGQEHLAVMRIYPKGIMRWHAKCCGAPLFNTTSSPKVYFATMRTSRLPDPSILGPVRVRAFVPKPGGGTRHEHAMILVRRVLSHSITALLSGQWRKTPFFDPNSRAPVRSPRILSSDERKAAGLVRSSV